MSQQINSAIPVFEIQAPTDPMTRRILQHTTQVSAPPMDEIQSQDVPAAQFLNSKAVDVQAVNSIAKKPLPVVRVQGAKPVAAKKVADQVPKKGWVGGASNLSTEEILLILKKREMYRLNRELISMCSI